MQVDTVEIHAGTRLSAHDVFQAALNRDMSVRFSIAPTGDKPFSARMTRYKSEQIGCADIHFSPHVTSLLPGGIKKRGESAYLLAVQPSGTSVISQGGRSGTTVAGSFFMIDTSRPFRIETQDIHTQSIYIPEARLRAVFPDIERCTAVPIPTHEGAGRLIRGAIEEMFGMAPTMSETTCDNLTNALPHILAVVFDAYLKHPVDVASTTRDIFHRERIKTFVRQNLGNPDLDCTSIAKAVNLSPRYVHELFDDEEQTLMRWVWKERMHRVRADLADPAYRRHTLSVIAFKWGFSDPAHFSRAFKASFGVSPRQFRNITQQS